MCDSSFYDEGLVAAAWGVQIEQNPYEFGSVAQREWRRGFLSYGTRTDEDDSANEEAQLVEGVTS
ncbi:MAG: hypothetical protein ACLPGW_04325 [Roseiarcus sp.]